MNLNQEKGLDYQGEHHKEGSDGPNYKMGPILCPVHRWPCGPIDAPPRLLLFTNNS